MNEANEFYKPSTLFLSPLLSNKRLIHIKVLIWKRKGDLSVTEDVQNCIYCKLSWMSLYKKKSLQARIEGCYISVLSCLNILLILSFKPHYVTKPCSILTSMKQSNGCLCYSCPHEYLVFLCWFFIRVCVSEPTRGPGMFLQPAGHASSSNQKMSHILGHG